MGAAWRLLKVMQRGREIIIRGSRCLDIKFLVLDLNYYCFPALLQVAKGDADLRFLEDGPLAEPAGMWGFTFSATSKHASLSDHLRSALMGLVAVGETKSFGLVWD